MTRGRALLRNYVATPEPDQTRPAKLPAMRGNQTMSAPARPDLWVLQNGSPDSKDVEEQTGPQELTTALLGASPVPQPLRRTQANTLVPSALDAHTFCNLPQSDDDWFAEREMEITDTWDEDWTLDDDTLEIDEIQELPRILGATVELGVFFSGIAIGLAVQGAFAWALWMALI